MTPHAPSLTRLFNVMLLMALFAASAFAQPVPENRDDLVLPPSFSGPPVVRIWLSDLPDTSTISCDGPCRVTSGASARILTSVQNMNLYPAKPPLPAFEFAPEGSAPICINGKPFPGSVRFEPLVGGYAIINYVDLERYLEGVLGAEMPPQWPLEALKAQAVAARGYALYSALSRNSKNWDLMSTVEDQVYSSNPPKPSVITAVRETRGQALLHDGRLFPTFFHSTCGGKTESPGNALGRTNFDFLLGVTCRYCRPSPHFQWQFNVSGDALGALMKKGGAPTGYVRDVILTEDAGGQKQVLVAGPEGHALLTMVDFRRIIGRMDIKSGRFQSRKNGDIWTFSGNGLGHGAGMCQWGARGMAAEGRPYTDILEHYYRSSTLEKLY